MQTFMKYGLHILMGMQTFMNYWLHTLAVVAHGRMVISSRQITEVKQRRARLVLGWVTESRCQPSVEVLGKPLISRRLRPPSSDGYLVERES